jgi:GntR family transcriptional regulator, transcriptional repressor for pyruvate dehydrogenase complex
MRHHAPFVTRESLAAELEEAILSGGYAVGEKLPSERELADRYRVSRPVIREALHTLRERRLVDIYPGRGAYVRPPQRSDAAPHMQMLFRRAHVTARDLIEARSALECAAAAQAAGRADAAEVESLGLVLRELDASPDVVEQARLDLTFHFGIARAARNPVLESMLATVAQPMVELMLRSLIDPSVRTEALDLHAVVLDAIGAGDAEGARAAMRRHLDVAARFYGDDLDRSVEAVARRELAVRLAPSITLEDVLARVIDGTELAPAAGVGQGDGRGGANASGRP